MNVLHWARVLGSALASAAGGYDRMAARRGAALGDLLGLLAAPREPSLAPASQPD